MRAPRFVLPLLASVLVGQGPMALVAQEREQHRPMRPIPVGERRGTVTPSSESSGRDLAHPMGGGDRGIRGGGSPRDPEGRNDTPMPVGPRIRTASTVAATPRYIPRCTVLPDPFFWQRRDLRAEIQWMSRRGFVPVTPVAEEVAELNGVANFPAGWKAYGFVVPAGGKLHVRLHHTNEGWFRLAMVNKWGDLGAGMLKNLIPTGNPEVRYTNPGKVAQAVYVIVDDPGWMSSAAYPYNLVVQRDWEPGKADTKGVQMVVGIWASNPVAGNSAEYGWPYARASFGLGARW